MEHDIQPPDLAEVGGQGQRSDRRLFMQLLVFGECVETQVLIDALEEGDHQAVLYADVNDPHGVGLLTMSENPDYFTRELRDLLTEEPFDVLPIKPEFTMLGRTYSLGYEPDLNDTLLQRPRRYVLTPDWPWAVWYPLRRRGEFTQLPQERQREILKEHGMIGRSFGRADLAHDVRLACFGLDAHDNDFVIGLTGAELHPLSAVVQAMRQTTQTALYLEKLGPFFIGRAIWQAKME